MPEPPVHRVINAHGRPGGLLVTARERQHLQTVRKKVKANESDLGVDGNNIVQTTQVCAHSLASDPPRAVGRHVPTQPGTKSDGSQARREQARAGIPKVTDRLISYALVQVPKPRIDPGFSAHNHRFHTGRLKPLRPPVRWAMCSVVSRWGRGRPCGHVWQVQNRQSQPYLTFLNVRFTRAPAPSPNLPTLLHVSRWMTSLEFGLAAGPFRLTTQVHGDACRLVCGNHHHADTRFVRATHR